MSQSRSVLVIDDDVAVTDTFARMLNLDGFDVRTATNADEGLKEAAARRPDAILLDLRMPIMNGLEFLRTLRTQETEHHTPVAIVTGDYFIDDQMLDEIRGLDAVVEFKPLWLEDLIAIARDLSQASR